MFFENLEKQAPHRKRFNIATANAHLKLAQCPTCTEKSRYSVQTYYKC